MSVNNAALPVASVSIKAGAAFYEENKGQDYALVIYSGGIVTTVTRELDSPVINLDILKRHLHTGVATMTLFTAGGVPLCERLFFVQNYDHLRINLTDNKSAYTKREQSNIRFNVLNRTGFPAEGHFSVSVIDENKVPADENKENNILSYFLLTSDLKGYIEQPGYYFAGNSAETRNNLDILLLTQGYRRFEWKQVLDSNTKPLAYQPEKGIEISGQIKNLFNSPIAKGTVTLIPKNGGAILSSTSDDKGVFRFSNMAFTDTLHFVLSAVNSSGKNTTKIAYFNKPDGPLIYLSPQQAVQPFADTVLATLLNSDKLQQTELVKYRHLNGGMLKTVN
ncbi:MAG: carboxypeptidase-like regulatory domain-containing protein, partial [Candidatus Saccharimonadales bacterium]